MKRLLRSITAGFDPLDILELNLDAERMGRMLEGKLTDLDTIEAFANLEHLNCAGHELQATRGLAAIPHLRTLDLSHNALADVQDISGHALLHELDLSYNHLTTTSGLTELPALLRLNLSHNRLQQVDELAGLPSLEVLTLSANKGIQDLGPLAGLGNLHTLYIKQLKPASFAPVAQLPALETLYLTVEDVSLMAPLADLPIRELHLSGRELQTLDALPPLPRLETLTISGCTLLKDVSALQRYPTLRHLLLPFNAIAKLDFVHALPRLETLDLRGNPVTSNIQQAVARFGHVPTVRYE